jgi:hypothetical protein
MIEKEKGPRSVSTNWQPFTLEEARTKFSGELYEDLRSIEAACDKMGKEISFDILESKAIFLINVGSEDMSWIYEVDRSSRDDYRQIFLTRDDLGLIFRRMNEKRRIRFV